MNLHDWIWCRMTGTPTVIGDKSPSLADLLLLRAFFSWWGKR